jgi:hypothetical protein
MSCVLRFHGESYGWEALFFERGELLLLAELLELIMKNAWDADVLCSRNGRADGLRAVISHDE